MMEYTVKSRTEGLKIGDKVIRIKGSNSGMNIGDSGTIILAKTISGIGHVKLKEYSNGWHKVEFLEKIEEGYSETMYDSLVKKAYGILYDKLNEVQVKTELTQLENLKQQKLDIENKIQELENEIENNIDEELPISYIKNIINDETDAVVDVRLHRKGRHITCLIEDIKTGKILGKGISKCCPGDKFDIEIGCKISYHRCVINYHKRQIFKLIHSTC